VKLPKPHIYGFTLIELMITVAIIGLLASVAVPFAELAVKRSNEQELRIALRQIRTALDEYKKAGDEGRIPRKVDGSGYPENLEVLTRGVPDLNSEKKGRIYFLRRLPRDPFSSNTAEPPEASWGKRSYESPPDNPAAGKDVYDVYSLSDGVGINGIPYREW
jgi:general secretion pathway protein G